MPPTFLRSLFRHLIAWGILVLPGAAQAQDVMPQGPTVATSELRGESVLDGVWKFQPAGDKPDASPAEDWGAIRVPGSWFTTDEHSALPGILKKGTGAAWNAAPGAIKAGWYEKEITVPAEWKDRALLLDFSRVSTDATIFVNGTKCGTISWPYGEVDVSSALRAGSAATLRIHVSATPDAGEKVRLMGYAKESKSKSVLNSAGLTGDVVLVSHPRGAVVSDVFVQPSFRKKEIKLDVELKGVQTPGSVNFTARMLNEKGEVEKTFEQAASVAAKDVQTVTLQWPWTDARLWDLDKPNLYTLQLSAKGAGLDDAYPQRFGFREHWIEGRKFFLNGVEVRWRPQKTNPFTPPEMLGEIAGMKAAGFNIGHIWAEDSSERGHVQAWEQYAKVASERGWPLIGPAMAMSDYVLGDAKAKSESDVARVKGNYQRLMETDLRRYRNEPSIVMWSTTPNIMNHSGDQDPRFIGQRAKLNAAAGKKEEVENFLGMIRKADPTRPVFVHAGNRGGDVFSVNHYLDLIPLQEREEWMSDYVQSGDVPYMGVEFGTPLNTNMNRGRAGFGPSHPSEPLMTEFSAIYLGPEAYKLEPADYRSNLRFGFNGKDWNGDWTRMQKLQSAPDTFQQLQALFIRNTWRSWRTAGVTGGMVPWNSENQTFLPPANSQMIDQPAYQPGTRGIYKPRLSKDRLFYLQEEGGWKKCPSSEALKESNHAALAWIAGPAQAFTEKSHSFRPGVAIEKQIVLINDERQPQDFVADWSVVVAGKQIAGGHETGQLQPAKTSFLPVRANIPKELSAPAGAADGEIKLTAKIGDAVLNDTFAFRVFPQNTMPKTPAPVLLADPVGKTAALLRALNISTMPWNGKPAGGSLLIVGREALSAGQPLPGDLRQFVSAGGRLLIMTQKPEFFTNSLGLRVAPFPARRVFPVTPTHPVVAGLDARDLCDWSGESTLIDPKPRYEVGKNAFTFPIHGWHWGNRGSVSSVAIEKPHLGGWRPILECEFDLAYSPLMELDFQRGRVTLCTLDLEDCGAKDPAAEKIARQLILYAATAPITPRAATAIYLGGDEGAQRLKALGLRFTPSANLPPGAQLVILGNDANVTPAAISNAVRSGANILVLATPKAPDTGLFFGASIALARRFYAPDAIPAWPEAAGLSVSDLRLRGEYDARLLKGGPGLEVGASGLLARATPVAGQRGSLVYVQFDPAFLDTAKFPMLHFTRWRETRALSQVLANLGATFDSDANIFDPHMTVMDLSGDWAGSLTAPLPVSDWEHPQNDPGISATATRAVQPQFDDSKWEKATLPAWYPPLETQSGEYVFRKTIQIPREWENEVLQVAVARVKTFDTVFLNGKAIGTTAPPTKDTWNLPRVYRVPAGTVKAGPAVLAIRGFATDRQGGVHGLPSEMFIRVIASRKAPPPFYHPDYKQDFDFGDDPYRYYRW